MIKSIKYYDVITYHAGVKPGGEVRNMTTEASSENGYLNDDSMGFHTKMILTYSMTEHDAYEAMSDLHNGIMRMLEATGALGECGSFDQIRIKLEFVRDMLDNIVEDCERYQAVHRKHINEGAE